MVQFLAAPPAGDLFDRVRGQQGERIALGTREVSIAYGEGIGTSKLVLPDLGASTARNRNSVEKLAARLEGAGLQGLDGKVLGGGGGCGPLVVAEEGGEAHAEAGGLAAHAARSFARARSRRRSSAASWI